MIYRTEHPKPQFERENWINLNGQWQFEIDRANSGVDRKLFDDSVSLKDSICVPFCPQSRLSGIQDTDFMSSVWYKRTIFLSDEQIEGCVKLHFGAVDYAASVYMNGVLCGTHKGGYISFVIDITDYVHSGENILCVHAEDDERSRLIPSGKQCHEYRSKGCHYTRTTGIWQTVWLELHPKTYIDKVSYQTDVDNGLLSISVQLVGKGVFCAEAFYEGKSCGKASVSSEGGATLCVLSLTEKHLWEVNKGGLYDLVLTYGDDHVKSYFGLRSIDYRDYKFYLNGRSVFQRLVLDQGFYPDGIYTATSDDDFVADIERSQAMGFNGARLHEKIFEERFLYHADRMGYLVWSEYPSWGLDVTYEDSIYAILPEWMEMLERDRNHPAIVGWCPLCETWDFPGRTQIDGVHELLYRVTKAVDPTRPVIDASGGYHVKQDIYDVHDYAQEPEMLAEHYRNLSVDGTIFEYERCRYHTKYDGKQPFFVSEYGGIFWSESDGWGYGKVADESEFLDRLKALTDVLLDNPRMFAFCYTQLTDIEQEQNGLYTYDRRAKFSPDLIRPIIGRTAKVEE